MCWRGMLGWLVIHAAAAGAEEPLAPMFGERALFERALGISPEVRDEGRRVTGIVVPHHLTAADLIARGFRCAEHGGYRRVIVLSPDHFRRSRRPFATTRRDFGTVWGTVKCDGEAVDGLLAACPLAGEEDLFAEEHGVHAVTPFIARFFPEAEMLAVALRIDSRPEDWKRLAEALEPLVTEETLVVQSTDFSHYLPPAEARERDQETLDVLATGEAEGVLRLKQPDHLDSRAAQYVHLALQRRVHGAGPVVIGNRNSQDYTRMRLQTTTSYVVQVFEKGGGAAWEGGECWFFAGDAFFGRYAAGALGGGRKAEEVRERVLRITRGRPLVVNLEGVIGRNAEASRKRLIMDGGVTVRWLKSLNVRVAGVANNHAMDLGREGMEETRRVLRENGIEPLGEGEVFDGGRFRLVAMTDLSNASAPKRGRLTREGIMEALRNPAAREPVFAMVHAGTEFRREADERQMSVFGWLGEAVETAEGRVRSPVKLILGAHPHVASAGLRMSGRVLAADSLGNFIFDQPEGSGALVEVRFFEQGTHAARWIPLGNVLRGE